MNDRGNAACNGTTYYKLARMGSPPWPNRPPPPGTTPPDNRRPPGSGPSAGRGTEGVVVLLEPGTNIPPGDGNAPCVIDALRKQGPGSADG